MFRVIDIFEQSTFSENRLFRKIDVFEKLTFSGNLLFQEIYFFEKSVSNFLFIKIGLMVFSQPFGADLIKPRKVNICGWFLTGPLMPFGLKT